MGIGPPGQPPGHGQLKGETVRIIGGSKDIGVRLAETYIDNQQVLVNLTGIIDKKEETLPKGDLVEIVNGITLELTGISPSGRKAWIVYNAPPDYKFYWKG